MTQKETIGGLVSLTADPGMALHREGSELYHSEITVPKADVPRYTEVDRSEIPAFTKAQYDAKVAELVRERYSESEEFAILRKYLTAIAKGKPEGPAELAEVYPAVAEYIAYNDFVEACKVDAKNLELYNPINTEGFADGNRR